MTSDDAYICLHALEPRLPGDAKANTITVTVDRLRADAASMGTTYDTLLQCIGKGWVEYIRSAHQTNSDIWWDTPVLTNKGKQKFDQLWQARGARWPG